MITIKWMHYYGINKYFHLNVNMQPVWESGDQREARLEQWGTFAIATAIQPVHQLHHILLTPSMLTHDWVTPYTANSLHAYTWLGSKLCHQTLQYVALHPSSFCLQEVYLVHRCVLHTAKDIVPLQRSSDRHVNYNAQITHFLVKFPPL